MAILPNGNSGPRASNLWSKYYVDLNIPNIAPVVKPNPTPKRMFPYVMYLRFLTEMHIIQYMIVEM